MSFVDDILARVRPGGRPPARLAPSELDVVRAAVFERLDVGDLDESVGEKWLAPGYVAGVAAVAFDELTAQFGVSRAREELVALTTYAVLSLVAPGASAARRATDRVAVTDVVTRLNRGEIPTQFASGDLESYLVETRILDATTGALTGLGEVLRDLAPVDVPRWMLHMEAALAGECSGRWTMSASSMSQVLRARKYSWYPVDPDDDWPLGDSRLARFGLVSINYAAPGLESGWDLTPYGEAILRDVLSDPPSPTGLLVRAMLGQTTTDLTPRFAGAISPGADALRHLSTIVAHEIRNQLVPLRDAAQTLARDLPPERRERVSARALKAVAGIETFVNNLTALVKPSAPDHVLFDLLTVLQDALRETEAERNGHVTVHLQVVPTTLHGPPQRVATAFVNLIRNAAQARRSPGVKLVIEAAADDDVVIAFDDDGPGVDPALRETIFHPGVSSRGGAGFGLAFVRQVFVGELKGAVTCLASERGGARFEIRIPRGAGGS